MSLLGEADYIVSMMTYDELIELRRMVDDELDFLEFCSFYYGHKTKNENENN